MPRPLEDPCAIPGRGWSGERRYGVPRKGLAMQELVLDRAVPRGVAGVAYPTATAARSIYTGFHRHSHTRNTNPALTHCHRRSGQS